MEDNQALAVIQQQPRELVLSPVMDINVARSRMHQFQEFVAHYLEPSLDGGQDGGDFGPIPGAGKKKVLLKSGADKLTELYGLYDEYEIDAKEDFETKLFYYKIKCVLRSRRDDSIVGTGVGSCSTYESKYRYRDAKRKCPECGAEAIIKGKDFNNTGKPQDWLCFDKKGGCGKKFKPGDPAIEGQILGRVENPDIMDTVNTVLKMAKKRAKIDAVIGVTRSSGIFTQDLEEIPMPPAPPTVPRTTEPIEIGRPASSGGKAENVEGDPKPATPKPPVAPPPPPEREPGSDDGPAEECIDHGRQVALHRLWRENCPKGVKSVEKHFQDWLKAQGYVGGDGNGSTKNIPIGLFDEVKAALVFAASELRP